MAEAQGSAVRGASLLIILQIASRAITFIANQLLLRFLTAQLLGVSTQLEVYYLTVLSFARESLRVAIQRQGTTTTSGTNSDATNSHESQSVVNAGHLAAVLGIGSAVGLGGAYLYQAKHAATASAAYLDTALYIYGIASVIELLSEPAFVVLQHRLRFGPRAAAESLATFIRCIITLGSASWAWRAGRDLGVLPFALGQLGYGTGLLGVYLWYGLNLASAGGFSLLPKRIGNTQQHKKTAGAKPPTKSDYLLGYFYTPTLELVLSLTAQSFVKNILTQGDTFLMSILSSPESQGVYALANNYGSLLARLVFQPVEESSRNYFSKLLSTSAPKSASVKQAEKPTSVGPSEESIAKAATDLQAVFKSYILLSILIVTLGPFGAPLLVQIVAGEAWAASGAGTVLAQYCMYIPLLALNGVSEAFVSSVATEKQLRRQSLWMGAISVVFGTAGFLFLRVLDLGAVGLVYANAINMVCRIMWSMIFISGYFKKNGTDFLWANTMPAGASIYAVGTAALWQIFTRFASLSVGGVSPHVFKDVVKVAGLALPYVGVVAYLERRWLIECYQSLRGRN